MDLGEPITSSPAVSSTGVVYVVTTRTIDEENAKYISTLHTVSPSGVLVRSRILPDEAFTTASPKIWRAEENEYIFLFARRNLFDNTSVLVYDQAGNLVENKKIGGCPIHGRGIWDWFGDLWEWIKDNYPGRFDPSGSAPPGTAGPLYDEYGWLDPTPAIIDAPVFSEHPVLIFADSACFIIAFSWEPPDLSPLWSKQEELGLLSSPARLRGTKTVVFGSKDGDVRAYDMMTGKKLWTTRVEGGPVMGAPASRGIGTRIYVLSYDGTLTSLSASDGSKFDKVSIEGVAVSSPAMSSNLVYLQTTKGLVSIGFDFESWAATAAAKNGGLASPAVGPDGTIYTVTISADTAFLQAYGGRSIFTPSGITDQPVAE